jgi:hypothetical protein
MRGFVALTCALALGCGAAGARAEGIVPVEGPWSAETSAGLPVSFEVKQGHVVEARFKFRWGFCGTYESALTNNVAIEPSGHWKYLDPRGPWIEATFVAPDRAEGTVVAPSRMLPGCPETHASFAATPGALPPPPPTEVRVKNSINSDHLAKRPHKIVLSHNGSFYLYGLRWQSFGGPVARATGTAYTRSCRTCAVVQVERPRVTVRLVRLVPRGEFRIYQRLQFFLHGPLPEGFYHRGYQSLL